jgi:hypothetical protein
MKQKFTNLSSPVISEDRRKEIIAAVEALEGLADVRQLAALLTTD